MFAWELEHIGFIFVEHDGEKYYANTMDGHFIVYKWVHDDVYEQYGRFGFDIERECSGI